MGRDKHEPTSAADREGAGQGQGQGQGQGPARLYAAPLRLVFLPYDKQLDATFEVNLPINQKAKLPAQAPSVSLQSVLVSVVLCMLILCAFLKNRVQAKLKILYKVLTPKRSLRTKRATINVEATLMNVEEEKVPIAQKRHSGDYELHALYSRVRSARVQSCSILEDPDETLSSASPVSTGNAVLSRKSSEGGFEIDKIYDRVRSAHIVRPDDIDQDDEDRAKTRRGLVEHSISGSPEQIINTSLSSDENATNNPTASRFDLEILYKNAKKANIVSSDDIEQRASDSIILNTSLSSSFEMATTNNPLELSKRPLPSPSPSPASASAPVAIVSTDSEEQAAKIDQGKENLSERSNVPKACYASSSEKKGNLSPLARQDQSLSRQAVSSNIKARRSALSSPTPSTENKSTPLQPRRVLSPSGTGGSAISKISIGSGGSGGSGGANKTRTTLMSPASRTALSAKSTPLQPRRLLSPSGSSSTKVVSGSGGSGTSRSALSTIAKATPLQPRRVLSPSGTGVSSNTKVVSGSGGSGGSGGRSGVNKQRTSLTSPTAHRLRHLT